MDCIAGVDEVGRGPLAGPVVAAAVILPSNEDITGLKDSKKLTEKSRVIMAEKIYNTAVAWAIAEVSSGQIDELNIHNASLLAMQIAVEKLKVLPDRALIDGKYCPSLKCASEAIIKGDESVPCISAAAIIAKVYRDNLMLEYDKTYPGYGLAKHKGYPTKQHISAINTLGPTPIHRYSYAPVKQAAVERDDIL